MSPESHRDAAASGLRSRANRVYLIGFMGAGKSCVGQQLATRLGCPFVDLDAAIEAQAGMAVPQIFARQGEGIFRQLEHECLAATEPHRAVVVATGGGIVTSERNRAMIARLGMSVWLNPQFETIVARLGADAHLDRPLFRSTEQAQALFQQRQPLYQQADVRIDIGASDSPATVAETIARQLGRSPCAT